MRIRIFINRPILASVISIIIVLCGLVAMLNMPVAQYPNVSPPSISVQAQYPGASAETMERTVAAQLENQLNGVTGVLYMSSNSTGNGNVGVTLTFEIGTDLNHAVNDVLNRVHAAMPLLPAVVQALGVNVRKSSPDMLMVVNFFNNGKGVFNRYYMGNYLNRTVYNDLTLVPGVGQISLRANTYALRVWLDVNAMNSLNVTTSDIANAITEQSNEYIVGKSNSMPIESALLTFNVTGSEMYSNPKQFDNIVVRANGTQFIRIKDVAKVELGGNNYSIIPNMSFQESGTIHNYEIATMEIYMDPSGNQLDVKNRVLKKLKEDAANFPNGLEYRIAFDATQFVSASITNVGDALRDAFLLVGIVVLLFLQNLRASFIALLTVPVSVIGSFAVLYMLGFSINTLTLFAMILAIGIVVDDAIVVVENIERLKAEHKLLDIKHIIEVAMHEVFGAIIAIALVLSVVFLPVMCLTGFTGVLYRQFAVTISCTVIISAITALTLTPAISVLLLKNKTKSNWFSSKFNLVLTSLTNFYLRMAERLINSGKYTLFTLLFALITVAFIFKSIPLSFMPNEDQGFVFASVYLPSTASLKDTQTTVSSITKEIMKKKGINQITQIDGVDFFGGGANTYAATMIIILDNWAKRKGKHEAVNDYVDYINSIGTKYKNVTLRAFNLPPVRGLSTTGGVEFYLEDRTVGDLKLLDKKATELGNNLLKHKEIKEAYHLLNTNVEQILVEADVAKAKFYGVNVQDVYNNLHYIYSNYNVNFAYLMQGLVWVILQGDYRYRVNTRNMSNIYVRNNESGLVSINSLVKTTFYKSPLLVERFNDYPATKVIVTPKNGYSSGDIMKIIIQEMHDTAKSYDYEWFGTSYMQTRSQKTSIVAFFFAFAMIYLVLCALYEMWRLPLVVLMGMPFALLGSGLMLLARHQPNDLYFQISLITLLGLSAKNIILLIEFALQGLNGGMTAKDAVLHALKLRFRPIVMTSITFIVGALPLVFATGAGANAEHSVGSGIIGGMLGSVILGTLVAPSYFVLVMKNRKIKKG